MMKSLIIFLLSITTAFATHTTNCVSDSEKIQDESAKVQVELEQGSDGTPKSITARIGDELLTLEDEALKHLPGSQQVFQAESEGNSIVLIIGDVILRGSKSASTQILIEGSTFQSTLICTDAGTDEEDVRDVE